MLEPFANVASAIETLPIPNHECRDPQALAELAKTMGFHATAHPNIEAALAAVPTDCRVLIFGSLYLAGEVLAANDQLPD